jgi:hypothetical protein
LLSAKAGRATSAAVTTATPAAVRRRVDERIVSLLFYLAFLTVSDAPGLIFLLRNRAQVAMTLIQSLSKNNKTMPGENP